MSHTVPPTEAPVAIAINAMSAVSNGEASAQAQIDNAQAIGAKSIVLIGTPNGTVPDFYNPLIAAAAEKDVPTFILASNYGSEAGPKVKEVPYGSQVDAARAGAALLKTININGLSELLDFLKVEVDKGLSGDDLRQAVITRFEVPEPLTEQSAPVVEAKLFPDTTLDFAGEQEHLAHWEATGECREPTVIGTLELDDDAARYLQDHLQNPWTISDWTDIFAEDETRATEAAHEEGITTSLPDQKTRAIVRQVHTAFKQLVRADIARATKDRPGTEGELRRLKTHFGVYPANLQTDTHIDREGDKTMRYICTLLGPSSIFYTGNLTRNMFEDDGDISDSATIDERAEPVSVPLMTVVRFRADGDPHDIPTSSQPGVRLVVDASVTFEGTELSNAS